MICCADKTDFLLFGIVIAAFGLMLIDLTYFFGFFAAFAEMLTVNAEQQITAHRRTLMLFEKFFINPL